MLKDLVPRRFTFKALFLLTPAFLLLMLTLRQHFDTLNAPDPLIVTWVDAEPDWETRYPFTDDFPLYPIPSDVVFVGDTADLLISHYLGEWLTRGRYADWIGPGTVTLPGGGRRPVWRVVADGILIDIDAITYEPLLVIDGVRGWQHYNQNLWAGCETIRECQGQIGVFDLLFSYVTFSRFKDNLPYLYFDMLLFYLGFIASLMLLHELWVWYRTARLEP